MPDSGDENDSRTASVGMQRNQTTSNNSSRRSSQERSRKKQKRMGDRDVRDFVPQGGTFSANPLEVDPESMSSSRSQDSEGPAGLDGNRESATGTAERADNSSEGNSQFDKVNDRYWRSRSESGSARGEDGEISSDDSDIDEDTSSLSGSTHSGDSVDSEEADDSIMLNIGSRNQDSRNGEPPAQGSEYDPEPRRIIEEGLLNGGGSDTFDGAADSQHAHSKEEALRRFSSKYPTAPSSLVDLDREDFEIQAKYLHFDRDINDVNLDLPIACTECFQEGHLAEVCPSKECVHCGAWNQHQTSFCPSWRRCQKCRGRGHSENECTQVIANDQPAHPIIPCDFCGSEYHIENECDKIWKIPQKQPIPGPVLVSISCAKCTSNRHLIGDCPSLGHPIASSSWTLHGVDPEMISNINSVVGRGRGGPGPGPGPPGPPGRGRGMRIRGRADFRSPSPSSEDLPTRPRQPTGRNAGRPNIQIGSIGNKPARGGGGGTSGPQGSRQLYRDRTDFVAEGTRQRSLSPPRPARGRQGDSWKPPRGRGGSDRGGRGRGGRGSQRGGGQGNGDVYRPLPSAGKKAWDRYRL